MTSDCRDVSAPAGHDISLRCRCGRVRGIASDVSPSSGFRFVCYCNDCQAFARFLERPDMLDPAGGTDIFQMPPGCVKLTVGTDAVRCLRLSDKGVLRWYTDCCRTPIGNTAASPRFPAPAADRRPALISISHLLKPKLVGFCRRPGRAWRKKDLRRRAVAVPCPRGSEPHRL